MTSRMPARSRGQGRSPTGVAALRRALMPASTVLTLPERRLEPMSTKTPPELAPALGQHDAAVEADLAVHAVKGRLDTGSVGRSEAPEGAAATPRRSII